MLLERKIFKTLKESDESIYNHYNESCSYEEFIGSVFESIYYTESLFDNLNISLFITESDDLMVLDIKSEEKIKKNIIETIKDLFTKFVNFLKEKMKQFTDWLSDIYMKTNLYDNIMTKIGKGIKFEDLKIAKEKGWRGTPTNKPCVNPVSISDLKTLDMLKEQFDTHKYLDMCENIIKVDNLTDAKEIFDDIKLKAKETKKETKKRGASLTNYINNLDAQFNIFGEKEIKLFIYTRKSENKHYYPTTEDFIKVKTMAEKGQSFIKNYNMDLHKYLNRVQKELIDPEISNIKSFKMGNNRSNDKENDQINILYHKAKLFVSQLSLKAYSNAMSDVINLLRLQHKISIDTYLYWIMSTKKYITESVELTMDDYLELI